MNWLRAIVTWADGLAARSKPFSWLWHALVVVPGALVIARWPWTGPGLIFAYREGEQVLFRIRNRVPLDPVDHIMDVLAPGFAGWLIIPR